VITYFYAGIERRSNGAASVRLLKKVAKRSLIPEILRISMTVIPATRWLGYLELF